MFKKHSGDSILEWVVLAALVIVVLGVISYGIASGASGQGNNVKSWINSLAVPAALP